MLHVAALFWAPTVKTLHFSRGQSEKCEQRMLCAWGQNLLKETFQWNFPEWGAATPPHSLQTQLVLGWCLKGLEVGEEWWERLQRSSVWLEKRVPLWYIETQSLTTLQPLGGCEFLVTLFQRKNILTSHCCLVKVSTLDVLLRDGHLWHSPSYITSWLMLITWTPTLLYALGITPTLPSYTH